MNNQNAAADTSAQSQETAQIPEDFAAFESWRNNGELPAVEETPEEAAAKPAATKKTPPDSETDEEDQEQTPGQKGKGVQKRIDKLTAEKRALEARLAALETKPGIASPQQTADEGADTEPKEEDFSSYGEYVKAVTAWTINQREQTHAKAQADAKVAETKQTILKDWQSKVDAIAEKHPDFEEVLSEAALPMTAAMQEAIMTAEHGPELAYHLAKHPAEAERIAKLSPIAAGRELGRLEAQFATAEKAPETAKPKVTSAPKPPAPVGGRAAAPKSVDDPDLPYEDFERLRVAQLKRK